MIEKELEDFDKRETFKELLNMRFQMQNEIKTNEKFKNMNK